MKPKDGAAKSAAKVVGASIGLLWDVLSRDPNEKREKRDDDAAEKVRQLPEDIETEGREV